MRKSKPRAKPKTSVEILKLFFFRPKSRMEEGLARQNLATAPRRDSFLALRPGSTS